MQVKKKQKGNHVGKKKSKKEIMQVKKKQKGKLTTIYKNMA